ncbi:uncharacterized protein SAPINGB_P003979 [Magnusiomyces paraingens]|uniref:LYC1 C-terminal domain-containing protein n=1 Tax=Magnusiomyces paraingens TaxID=2606893 RepID=A0A5E8BZK0_9ASCO|nr:uncharacterized protein SAPINGB_P003979 [Saprochaete ingens]VVT54245.1 unnamed protein product [Saprochaete ingens]
MTVSYILKQVDSPEDLTAAGRIQHGQWYNQISFDKFNDKVKFISSTYSKPLDSTQWVLLDSETPTKDNGQLNILSSLVLFPRPVTVVEKGKAPQEVISPSIMAVVTPPEYRGKGYASHLLREITKIIDQQAKDNKVNFSTLWSEVGEYYSAFGYKSLTPEELYIDLSEAAPVESTFYTDLDEFSWLGTADFENLAQVDKTKLIKEMITATEGDGITRVAINPDADFFRFFWGSSTFDAHTTYPEIIPALPVIGEIDDEYFPLKTGARYGPVYIIWEINFGSDTVRVVRIHIDDTSTLTSQELANHLAVLLGAAVSQAFKWKLSSVTFWKGDTPVGSGTDFTLEDVKVAFNAANAEKERAAEAAVVVRKLTVPMIRISNEYNKTPVEWHSPGYYPWR